MRKLFYLSLLITSIVSGQRADFFREDLTFRLDSISFDVDGYYWFVNNSSGFVNSEIFYPFPKHKENEIDSIRAFNLTTGKEAKYILEENGISFKLNIEPFDTVLFQIGYKQKLSCDSAVYILRTTKGWGKPLKLAEYKLVTPVTLPVKNFSYPPDKKYEIDKYCIFYWKKENFMPEMDMIFYLEQNK
jgi:hypothetical protein